MNYFLQVILLLQIIQTIWGSSDGLDNTKSHEPLTRVRRGGLSMLRLGRGLQMLRLGKRGMPMLRLGRSESPELPSALTMEQYEALMEDLNNNNAEWRRQVPLPRYGKDLEDQYRLYWFLMANANEDAQRRDMYELPNGDIRRIRPGPRPGRFRRSLKGKSKEKILSSEERHVPYPRIGRFLKSEDRSYYENFNDMDGELNDKRGMPMLRLGRGMPMLRLGKRLLPRLLDDEASSSKRGMPMLRLGKRTINSEASVKQTDSGLDKDKRGMPMLRLGRSSH